MEKRIDPTASQLIAKTPNSWLELKRDTRESGSFYFTERKGIDSVAIVLFNTASEELGLINEAKPPFNERYKEEGMHFKTTALGGSLFDAGYTRDEWLEISEEERLAAATKTAIKEVREEVGYNVNTDDMHFCGKVVFNSMSNEYTYLFLAKVVEEDKCERDPQSANEEKASLVWLSPDNIDTTGFTCGKAAAIFMNAIATGAFDE